MATSRFARWLLTRTTAADSGEALVGDLMEEIDRGRSTLWVSQQMAGLYAFAVLAHARRAMRITPLLVALVLGLVLAGGASIVPPARVLETWTTFYYLAGTVSLFAHVMSRSTSSRTLPITDTEELRS